VADQRLGRPVLTAADLDAMTPQQVEKAWRDSIVTDPESLPESYLQTLRERSAQRLAEREPRAPS
jgi:hypothetical protein